MLQSVQRIAQGFAPAALTVQRHRSHRVAVEPSDGLVPQLFFRQENYRPRQRDHQRAGIVHGQVVAGHQERAKGRHRLLSGDG